VSGVGTYTGTFSLVRGWEQEGGALPDLGEVEDAFTVTANGTRLPPQDPGRTLVGLSSHARQGKNTVVVQVSTPLDNAVLGAGKAYGPLGTKGAVTVTPYGLLHPDANRGAR
jgi:hypothetical protein